MRKHGSLGGVGADPLQKIFAILGSKILLTTKKMLTNKEGIKTSVRISRDITVTNSGKDTRLPNNVMANRFPTIPASAGRFSNFFVFTKKFIFCDVPVYARKRTFEILKFI